MTQLTILTDETAQTEIRKSGLSGNVRKRFDTFAEAFAAFESASETAKKYKVPVAFIPQTTEKKDANGKVIESIDNYEGSAAILAVVGARKRNEKGKMVPGIRGVVQFAAPTLETFLNAMNDDERVIKWLEKIVEKEVSHVAFRELRNAATDEELILAVGRMPTSVDDFIVSGREALDQTTYTVVWPEFKAWLKDNQPALHSLIPAKAEMLKCIRSASYARAMYADLEKAGAFVFCVKAMIQGALHFTDQKGVPDPQDVSALEEWLADRDTVELTLPTTKDYSNLPDFTQMSLGSDEEDDDGDDVDEIDEGDEA